MSLEKEHLLFGAENANFGTAAFAHVRLRLRSFRIPPIRDAAVIGRSARISPEVMKRALRFISSEPFVEVDLYDDKIASLFVRRAILQSFDADLVKKNVLRKIKPLMHPSEILALSLDFETASGARAAAAKAPLEIKSMI